MNKRHTLYITCAGDSITDCDCVKPATRKDTILMRDLGYGYVNLLYGRLQLTYPDIDIKLRNQGIGGDRTIKLVNRFDEVLNAPIDILTIMIGVNDVWAKFYASDRPDVQTSVEEYISYLQHMVDKAKEHVKHVIFISPFYLDQTPNNAFLDKLRVRQDAMKQVASINNIMYIDVQEAFNQLLQKLPVSSLSTDYIHINAIGHTLISDEVCSVIQDILKRNENNMV